MVRPEPDDAVLATDLQDQATYRLTEALVEAENQMRRRVQLLSDVVFGTDPDGRIVFLNDAWTGAVGEAPAECIGRRLVEFVHADDRPRVAEALAAPGARRADADPVIRVRRADGSDTWAEMSIAALPAGGAVGVFHDITQRKKAQDELAKLSLVASYTHNLVVITDRFGKTEWVNQAFCAKTGYTLEEMVGCTPGSVLQGPGTDAETVARIGGLIREGRSFEAELLNYTKRAEPYWVRVHITPIRDEQGDIVQFVSVQADSSELHQTQRELEEAKERAEAANEAKTRFLATISREMRTPLNSILGSADLAFDGEDDPAALNAHLRRIKYSSEVLLRLINDMLDVAKIEAGQIDVELVAVDLRACVNEAVAPAAERALGKHLEFGLSWDDALPPLVLGDPVRFQQIVNNLAENAVRFTDQGFVQVSVSRVLTDAGSAEIEIRVVDSGTGISESAQARIFERFEQGETSLTRRKGGAGLGLSIVRSLVGALGGTVGVRSQVGSGSDFRVRLPLLPVPNPAIRHPVVGAARATPTVPIASPASSWPRTTT
jgi:PAS domain S-box-containing protein